MSVTEAGRLLTNQTNSTNKQPTIERHQEKEDPIRQKINALKEELKVINI